MKFVWQRNNWFYDNHIPAITEKLTNDNTNVMPKPKGLFARPRKVFITEVTGLI